MTDPTNPTVSAKGLAAFNGNPDLADYFLGNSNRMAACRTMIDLLDIQPPAWALRAPSGRAARAKAVTDALLRDDPYARFDR